MLLPRYYDYCLKKGLLKISVLEKRLLESSNESMDKHIV